MQILHATCTATNMIQMSYM